MIYCQPFIKKYINKKCTHLWSSSRLSLLKFNFCLGFQSSFRPTLQFRLMANQLHLFQLVTVVPALGSRRYAVDFFHRASRRSMIVHTPWWTWLHECVAVWRWKAFRLLLSGPSICSVPTRFFAFFGLQATGLANCVAGVIGTVPGATQLITAYQKLFWLA